MPPTSIALRGGINRIAGLALYQLLLQQCRTISLPDKHAIELRNVLRNKFEANRNAFGRKKVTAAFQTGYEALDILSRTSTEGAAGAQSLGGLISRIPTRLRSAPRPSSNASTSTAQPIAKRIQTPSTTVLTDPASTNVLARPRPLSLLPPHARRHVPVWAEANGIPFLRTKKPVPNSLSGYIHKRIDRRQARTDRLALYEGVALWEARCEDEWDDIVSEMVEWTDDSEDSESKLEAVMGTAAESKIKWEVAIHLVVAHLREQQGAEREKNLKMSRALLEVVRKERALAEEERRERGRAKNRERRRVKKSEGKAEQR